MPHRLIVVFGLPGSGKTTVSRIIQNTLGNHNCEILRTDDIRKELFPNPIYSQQEAEEVFLEMYSRANILLKHGKTVVLDGVFAQQQERNEAQKVADKNNCECRFLHIFTDERTTKERLAKFSPADGEADYEVYLKLKRLFNPIKENIRKIDNSKDLDRLALWVDIALK